MRLRSHPTIEKIATWLNSPSKTGGLYENAELGVSAGTSLGLVRTDNQDRVLTVRFSGFAGKPAFHLFAVADGMGGMQDGGFCASLALAAIVSSLINASRRDDNSRLLAGALDAANREVYAKYRGRGGTTVVLILTTDQGITGASVGDSRIYTMYKGDLRQISYDDSIGAEVARLRPDLQKRMDMGGISSHITQFVGAGAGVEPHFYHELKPEDPAILFTDGIHRIQNVLINEVLVTSKSPGEAIYRLVTIANWCGGKDNASALMIYPKSKAWQAPERTASRDPRLELWDCFGKYELYVTSDFEEMQQVVPRHLEPIAEPRVKAPEEEISREVAKDQPIANVPTSEPKTSSKRKKHLSVINKGDLADQVQINLVISDAAEDNDKNVHANDEKSSSGGFLQVVDHGPGHTEQLVEDSIAKSKSTSTATPELSDTAVIPIVYPELND